MSFGVNRAAQYTYSNNTITFNANVIANTGWFLNLGPQNATNVTFSNGALWSSNTFSSLKTVQGSASSTISGVLYAAYAGNTFANVTNGETSLIPTVGRGTTTIPANYLTQAKMIRITIDGLLSHVKSSNLNMSVYLGNTLLVNTTAGNMLPQALTNTGFMAVFRILCTNNITSTILASGFVSYDTNNSFMLVPALPGVTVNTAANLVINVTATLTGGTIANLNIYGGLIELLG